MNVSILRCAGLCLPLATLSASAPAGIQTPSPSSQVLNLDQCLRVAQENSHRRPATALGLEIAQAQHSQALSGYWPQVSLQAGFQHDSKAPNFMFPSSSFPIPGQVINLGPGLAIPIPGQTFQLPAQDVKLMDKDTTSATLDASWLLWDGGLRRGLTRQSQSGLEVARTEVRRTDLEIHDSVTRYYYGAVLARQLHQLGKDTLDRMEVTLSLTETMYKEGSGRVKKTDWLDNKVMVETVRAAVVALAKNKALAEAALANTLGMGWQKDVMPADTEIPFVPSSGDMEAVVGEAYQWNVDWKELESGLKALEGAETQANSGHYPKLGFTVDLNRYWNGYDMGLSTSNNKSNWTVGIGVKIPVFSGHLVSSRVHEAHARLEKSRQEQLLLKEGIGLMVKNTLLGLDAARKSQEATGAAMEAAVENRKLSTQAYQSELVDTQTMVKAQLMESLMTAQFYKDRYDYISLQSQLTLIVGREIWKRIE